MSQASSPEYPPINALRTYLSSLPTQTAFYSATQTLIRLLLLHTAASRRSSHLILGTSLTSLSINLISGIAQGAGFSVAEEAKEEWNPKLENGITVRIVRPLRDVGLKECALWAWWCGLPIVGTSTPLNDVGKHGIGSLTRGDLIDISLDLKKQLTYRVNTDFIYGLETDYPATVSTIARTCAKLAPKEASNNICVLCGRYVSLSSMFQLQPLLAKTVNSNKKKNTTLGQRSTTSKLGRQAYQYAPTRTQHSPYLETQHVHLI